MKSEEIRSKFLAFFAGRGHAIVPSSSLIPDDPSVLLTTAGMQQFKKYYTGEADAMKDFGMLNAASVQKSFRTSDIDEVGDESHLTFFEMLGTVSFGGYFKKEAIKYAHDFITKEMGLEISYVTIFQGSDVVPKDKESEEIWKSLGVTDVREEGMEDVFWGPTGSSGPCGPTTELYCKNAAGQDVEIWNIVFNEFLCSGSREQLLAGNATLTSLEKKGIDTGMGLERLAMISQNKKNIFETDLFEPILEVIHKSGYKVAPRVARIMVDHARACTFLLADGVCPSNKEVGYVLRRLMRRGIVSDCLASWNINGEYSTKQWVFKLLIEKVQEIYGIAYPEVKDLAILDEYDKEYEKFSKTLTVGLKILNRAMSLDAKEAFKIYESYGLPYEIIREYGPLNGINFTRQEFDEEFKKHQELSRAGQEKKFGGHGLLLDTGELKAADERELKIVTRLHTTTHLLQAALRKVLGNEVSQQGSDITAERTRFDFSFSRKLTSEEIKQVEDILNEAVARDFTVEFKEMSYGDAVKLGALHFFREKYPETVKVYSVFDPKTGEVFSREFCGGPHVTHTGEIGRVKILKEEASSAGIRRIRASVSS
ncbi:MAG: alanine--tRNA ligase-related protein [Candidatus Sungbacteria bacterium]|nr:alanine--tRNA ligase-related protein [Candidatus Sungbacteria bacterium]